MDVGARRRLPSWMLGAGDVEPPRKSSNRNKKHNVAEQGACPGSSKTRMKVLDTSAAPQGDGNLGGTSHDHSKDEGEPPPVRVRSKTKRLHDKDALPRKSQTLGAISHDCLKGERGPAHGRSKATIQPDRDALAQENQTLGTNPHDCKRKRLKRTLVVEQDAECNVGLASSSEEVNLSGRIVQISSTRGNTNVSSGGSSGNRESLAAGTNDEELNGDDLLIFAREYLEGTDDEKQPEPSGGHCEFETENLETANRFVNSVLHHSSYAAVSAHETTINDTGESVENEQNTASTAMTGNPAQDMLELLLGPLLRKPAEEKKMERIMKDTAFRK